MDEPMLPEPMPPEIRGVSIVIPNYNYGRFLGEAIDSALAQTHPLVEVIVVDDGSTDGSRAVIEGYGDRVTAIFQANAGQARACEAGFRRSRQPIVLFLDADDRLLPDAAATVAAAWRAGSSKQQFRLQVIDAEGTTRRHLFPKYPASLDPATVRAELLRTGYYTCPPTSGNAFARDFLAAVLPFDGHRAVDALLNTLAPLYGDVVTVDRVIGHYRVHGSSDSGGGTIGAARFAANIADERARVAVLAQACRRLGIVFDGERSLHNFLPFRELELVAAKLADGERQSVLRHAIGAIEAGAAHPQKRLHRLVRAAWVAAVALAPRRLAVPLIGLRYLPSARPPLLERCFELFRRRDVPG